MSNKYRVYLKNEAFNKVYEELQKNPNADAANFDSPKRYHPEPEKLNLFKSYIGYARWSNELYAASVKLLDILREIYNRSKKEKASWYSNKKGLNKILEEVDLIKIDLDCLYNDIYIFQKCMLATGIDQKGDEIEALSDQIRNLTGTENLIFEICNRKIYEISSTRMTLANFLVALAAIILAA